MPLTPAQMIEAVTRNMKKNTGKTADEWTALLKKTGPKHADEKTKYAWFRAAGVPHVAARVLSGALEQYDAPDKLVAAQYSGAKKSLRPIYDAVLKTARKLGKDVVPRPCKTYVPLHRSKTFAIIKPERSHVAVGLCLDKSTKPSGRLTAAKNLGSDRVTHKLTVASPNDVNAELTRWLRTAYDLA